MSVKLGGFTIRVGNEKFTYRGSSTAHFSGRDALAWFDPENPRVAVLTNLERHQSSAVCVERSQEPDALECLTNPESETLKQELARIEGQASYMKARFNVVKTKFDLPRRQMMPDAQTLALGRRIEEGQKEIQQRNRPRTPTQREVRLANFLRGEGEESVEKETPH